MEECGDKAGTIMSCSDQNFDTVVELGPPRPRPWAPTTSWFTPPCCHFITDRDDTVYNY